MIAIIDYGVGNIGSITNMLKRVTSQSIILAHNSNDLQKADKFILPGVGSFDYGLKSLNNSGMREELDKQVKEFRKPILGICLGMQMLGKSSSEGTEKGLGYVDFVCEQFQFETQELKIPHMGWDYVDIVNSCDLVNDPIEQLRFYFVHSFYAICANEKDCLMKCDYGISFSAAIHNENVYGVQFHPEKSHKFGKWLLYNFSEKV